MGHPLSRVGTWQMQNKVGISVSGWVCVRVLPYCLEKIGFKIDKLSPTESERKSLRRHLS